MKQWLKKHFKQHMIRPAIYKTLSYFLSALALVLFWNRLVNAAALLPLSYAYTIIGLFFFALAWLNYLRLDGVKLPVMTWLPLSTRKRPRGAFSDISDYLDEEVVSVYRQSNKEAVRLALLLTPFLVPCYLRSN